MAQSCTARSSGSMTIPRHCSWGAPARTGERVAAATSDGRVLVGVSDLATYTVRPAEPSWARTISNRRPLVCKAAFQRPHRLTSAGDVDMSWWRVPAVSPCLPFHRSSRRVMAHSWHTRVLDSQRDPKTHLSKTRTLSAAVKTPALQPNSPPWSGDLINHHPGGQFSLG